MASAIDSLVANLTTTLQAMSMWEDTLLVFSSDNGGPSELGTVRVFRQKSPRMPLVPTPARLNRAG